MLVIFFLLCMKKSVARKSHPWIKNVNWNDLLQNTLLIIYFSHVGAWRRQELLMNVRPARTTGPISACLGLKNHFSEIWVWLTFIYHPRYIRTRRNDYKSEKRQTKKQTNKNKTKTSIYLSASKVDSNGSLKVRYTVRNDTGKKVDFYYSVSTSLPGIDDVVVTMT